MSNSQANEIIGQQLRLVPTNIPGASGIVPPTAGFDPRKASRKTLLQYGFPLRPDPAQSIEAAHLWDRAMARPLVHLLPELRLRPERKELGRTSQDRANNTSPNWSGGVALTTDTFETVSGSWTVPSVTAPGTADGDWWSVAWIGIDGWNSGDVLQAGTGQHVSRNGGKTTTEYFAWYEWYPNNWTEITNLTVNPGDAIQAMVRYLGIQNGVGQGSATLSNLTTGQSVTVALTAPSGTTLAGNSAEWIMERPTINGTIALLPDYGHTTFSGCSACTNKAFVAGSTATPTDMMNGSDRLSSTVLGSDWDCSFVAAS